MVRKKQTTKPLTPPVSYTPSRDFPHRLSCDLPNREQVAQANAGGSRDALMHLKAWAQPGPYHMLDGVLHAGNVVANEQTLAYLAELADHEEKVIALLFDEYVPAAEVEKREDAAAEAAVDAHEAKISNLIEDHEKDLVRAKEEARGVLIHRAENLLAKRVAEFTKHMRIHLIPAVDRGGFFTIGDALEELSTQLADAAFDIIEAGFWTDESLEEKCRASKRTPSEQDKLGALLKAHARAVLSGDKVTATARAADVRAYFTARLGAEWVKENVSLPGENDEPIPASKIAAMVAIAEGALDG